MIASTVLVMPEQSLILEKHMLHQKQGPLKILGGSLQIRGSQGCRPRLKELPTCFAMNFSIRSFWVTLGRRFPKEANFLILFLFILSADTSEG